MIIISFRNGNKELAEIVKDIKELKRMAVTFQDTLDELVQDELDEKVALQAVRDVLVALNTKVQTGLDQIALLTSQLGNAPTPEQLAQLQATADALKVDTKAIVNTVNPPVTP